MEASLRRLRDDLIVRHLIAVAIGKGDWKQVSIIADMERAKQLSDEGNLTGNEMAEIFGLQKNEAGEYNFYELFNACLHWDDY